MRLILCLAVLLLTAGVSTAQGLPKGATNPVAAVRSVKIVGTVVENGDADSDTIRVRHGEKLVPCLRSEDSIAMSETGQPVSWHDVQPGCLITAQCLCGAGKVVIESMVLLQKKSESGDVSSESRSRSETSAANGGMDYGVCLKTTLSKLTIAGANGSSERTYHLEKGTQCMDESGMPLPVTAATQGSVMTIRYVEIAGRLLATEVVVGKKRAS